MSTTVENPSLIKGVYYIKIVITQGNLENCLYLRGTTITF